jgi:hypothetical protein
MKSQGIDAHQKIVQAKQKKIPQAISRKDREAGWKLLMERQELVTKLKQLNDELDDSYADPFISLTAVPPEHCVAGLGAAAAGASAEGAAGPSGVVTRAMKEEPRSPEPSNSGFSIFGDVANAS